MKKRIVTLIVLMVVMSVMVLSGCMEDSVDSQQAQDSEAILAEAYRIVGMPNIKNFFELKMAREVLEKCDDVDLVTYLYTQNLEGKLIYMGRGIGFGVPYSVQFTNPERIARSGSSTGYAILPQADPSGLFKPDGLSATWYMLIDEETGESYVEYYEQDIIVKQIKAPRRLCAEWSLPENY